MLAAPAYIAEIAETKYRGALGTLMCLMCGLGILFINLNCNTDFRGTLTTVSALLISIAIISYKVLSGVCILFPALMALWMVFMPRSPVFLVSKGDLVGARKSLQWLRARKDVEEELEEIQANSKEREELGSVTMSELMTKSQYVRPLGIVLVLMALQQVSGANYVLSYSVVIFKVFLLN